MNGILFVCDADPRTGFGHLARCIALARLARARHPDVRLAFQGTFAAGAHRRLVTALPEAQVHAPGSDVGAAVAVIDRMADTEDPDAWDVDLLDRLLSRCGRVLHIASGRRAPALPRGAKCVGYQPGGPEPDPPRLYWSFAYAPVADECQHWKGARRVPGRAVVALGGNPDDGPLALTLRALSRVASIRTVDVLGSPVRAADPAPFSSLGGQTVTWHPDPAPIASFLAGASLVVASMGNLAYEALALGAPLCLLGQKRFQAEIADTLAARGLAVSAGHAASVGETALAAAIETTLENAADLSSRGPAAVDGCGLARLLDLVLEEGGGAPSHNRGRVVGIIQARMGSRRLPGKVLRPLAGAPLLQRLIERVRGARGLDALAVATSTSPADDDIANLCRVLRVACFRGSEVNVLDRVLAAAEALDAGLVVRLTADNPLVGADLVEHTLDATLAADPPPDYAHTVDGTGFPPGLSVEAVTVRALREAARRGNSADREHVTLYMRRRPERFRHLAVPAPFPFEGVALTVDTEADYARVSAIFEDLYARSPDFGFREVMTCGAARAQMVKG